MRISFIRAPLLIALTMAPVAAMAQIPAQAAQEISFLLDTVAASHCQFNRNGSWYDSDQARAHLRQKYDYLQKRKLALTAESFIERAGSTSSISGKPYKIQCPGAAPVDSGAWLTSQLTRYRTQGK